MSYMSTNDSIEFASDELNNSKQTVSSEKYLRLS